MKEQVEKLCYLIAFCAKLQKQYEMNFKLQELAEISAKKVEFKRELRKLLGTSNNVIREGILSVL